ncbi:MAG: class II aldolase/adducin family protein [Thermotogota bacterium]
MLDSLKQEVWKALKELAQSGLVAGTSGNVSGRDGDCVVIKPSGIDYATLTPDRLVVVDLAGRRVEGTLKPSVDTLAHLWIYRACGDVGGVVHTHSTYATVFAVLGRPLPVYVTELADLFGGPIPVSEYIPPADERIGEEFATRTAAGRYRALLMRNHGVFTAGFTPTDALAAARLVEHSAEVSVWAERLGSPEPLPADEVRRLHAKYSNGYGQGSR